MRFKKKPDIVEAFQWTGGPDQTEDPEWVNGNYEAAHITETAYGIIMVFRSDKGSSVAHPGDYIVKDEEGDIYSLSELEFKSKYEPVE